MKAFLITLLIISSPFFFWAQSLQAPTVGKSSLNNASFYNYEKPDVGKLIWEEDFNREKWQLTVIGDTLGYLLDTNAVLPTGWSFVDSTGNNFFWHWSDVGPRGRYTSENTANSILYPNNTLLNLLTREASIQDGFILMESDYYNSPNISDWYEVEMNSYIEFGPIDFSDYGSLIFNCKIFDRYCCDINKGTYLEISSDYVPGVNQGHWTSYKLRDWFDGDNRQVDELDYYVNITNSSAHNDSVYFRIWKRNASHYYVIVDDIRILEGPKNNLEIIDAWADYISPSNSTNEFIGGYTMFPKDAVSSFKQFRAAVWNGGSNTAENTQLQVKLFKDDALLDSIVSESTSMSYNERDTLSIATDFTPNELGYYQVSMTVGADFVDEFPYNNSWGYEFETTEHTFSRVRHGKENEFAAASTRDWYSGGFDGDMLLVRYDLDLEEMVEFSGLNVYVYPTTDTAELAAIEKGDFQLKARVFEQNDGSDSLIDVNLSSGFYVLTQADLGGWLYLPFVNEGSLMHGSGVYYVGVEQYTGTDAQLRLRIGSDDFGVKQPLGSNYIYQTESANWGYVNANFAIDLMLNFMGYATLTINYDMSEAISSGVFDPDNDTVFVTGSFNNWLEPGNGAIMAIYDEGSQFATAKIEIEKSVNGTVIEYKGFVNSGWYGGEWDGSPNRLVTIIDKDVELDHCFGLVHCADDINETNLSGAMKFYPNPFNNYLILENLEDADQIQLLNGLGQVVKTSSVKSATEKIATEDLQEGLYILIIRYDNFTQKALPVIKE